MMALRRILGCLLLLQPDAATGIRLDLHHHSLSLSSSTSSISLSQLGDDNANAETSRHPVGTSESMTSLQRRGGDCSDSNPSLFTKIILGATVETSLMYALVTSVVTLKNNNVFQHNDNNSVMSAKTRLPELFQAFVLLAIIFGSATFGAVIDRGLSAATKQILDPNRIPVS